MHSPSEYHLPFQSEQRHLQHARTTFTGIHTAAASTVASPELPPALPPTPSPAQHRSSSPAPSAKKYPERVDRTPFESPRRTIRRTFRPLKAQGCASGPVGTNSHRRKRGPPLALQRAPERRPFAPTSSPYNQPLPAHLGSDGCRRAQTAKAGALTLAPVRPWAGGRPGQPPGSGGTGRVCGAPPSLQAPAPVCALLGDHPDQPSSGST